MKLNDFGLIFLIIVLSGAALTDAKYPFDKEQQEAAERDTLASAPVDQVLYNPEA